MIHKLLGASWQTKIPAIAAAIALLIGQVGTLIDNNPKTVPDVTLIVSQIMVIVALFQARANSTTSEMVKAAAKPQGQRR